MSPPVEKQLVSCPACDLNVSRAKLRSHLEEVHMGRGSLESLDLCCTQCDFQVEHRQLEEMALHCGQSGHQFHIEWESFILREEHRIRESVTFVMEANGYRQGVEEEEMTDACDGSAESSPPSTPPVTIPRATPSSPAITTPRASSPSDPPARKRQRGHDVVAQEITTNQHYLTIKQEHSTPKKEEDIDVCETLVDKKKQVSTPKSPSPPPSPPRIREEQEEEEEEEETPRARNRAVKHLPRGIFESGAGDRRVLSCEVCNQSVRQNYGTPFGLVKTNGIQHALTHSNVSLFHCTLCPIKNNQKSNLKAHWKSMHSEQEWTEEGSVKTVVSKATKEEVVRCVQACYPGLRWNGVYLGINFLRMSVEEGEDEGEEEVTESPTSQQEAIKNLTRDTPKSGTGNGRWLLCKLCNQSVLEDASAPLGTVRRNGLKHALTHTNVSLYHCTRCDYKSNFRGNIKRHWKSHHSEEEWREEGSMKTVVSEATKEEVVRCVQACFPNESWNGKYPGINFFA